jgi:hypothetical protein
MAIIVTAGIVTAGIVTVERLGHGAAFWSGAVSQPRLAVGWLAVGWMAGRYIWPRSCRYWRKSATASSRSGPSSSVFTISVPVHQAPT